MTEKMIQKFQVQSVFELESFIQTLPAYFTDRTVLLLNGPVGAGKTESVKALTKFLQFQETASPSFAIHHKYTNSKLQTLDHLDLYRLENEDDLESTGFWDLFSQKKGLIVIEWADRLNLDYLPFDWKKLKIQIEIIDKKTRQISFFEILN